jgi:hypothetical protein
MISDEELNAFRDSLSKPDAAETFAGAVVTVYEVFLRAMSTECAEVLTRDYWNFLLDAASVALEEEEERESAGQ